MSACSVGRLSGGEFHFGKSLIPLQGRQGERSVVCVVVLILPEVPFKKLILRQVTPQKITKELLAASISQDWILADYRLHRCP